MSIRRATGIMLMRKAVDKGQSRSSFIAELRTKGLTYRKTTMLGDWRSLANLDAKKDLLKYVRKDRIPGKQAIAVVTWDISEEYMYICKVQSRISPDEPITERNINITQDKPLTPLQIEQLAWEMISEQSPKQIAQIVGITPFAAVRRE